MKLSQQEIQLIQALDGLTGAVARDCLETGDMIVFLVQPGDMGKAIGKKGIVVKKLEERLNKRILIVESAETPAKLFENFFQTREVEKSEEREEEGNRSLFIRMKEGRKGEVLRNRKRLEAFKLLAERNLGLKSLRIL